MYAKKYHATTCTYITYMYINNILLILPLLSQCEQTIKPNKADSKNESNKLTYTVCTVQYSTGITCTHNDLFLSPLLPQPSSSLSLCTSARLHESPPSPIPGIQQERERERERERGT